MNSDDKSKPIFDIWLGRITGLLTILKIIGIPSAFGLISLIFPHRWLLLKLPYDNYLTISLIVYIILLFLLSFLFFSYKNTKKKLKSHTDWEKVKEQYELFDVDDGVKVYRHKEQTNLLVCTHCFNIHNKKSILQLEPTSEYKVSKVYHCNNCNSFFKIKDTDQTYKPRHIKLGGPYG